MAKATGPIPTYLDDEDDALPLAPPPRAAVPPPADDDLLQEEAVGLPAQAIDETNSTPVKDGTLLAREALREEQRVAELLAALEPTPPFWARWLGATGLRWTAVLLGSALMLFVFAQAALFASQVWALPEPARTIALAGGGVLVFAFLFATGRLLLIYSRLRTTPAFQSDALYELSERRLTRAAHARAAFDAVYARVRPILATYPLGTTAFDLKLLECGATADDLDRLTKLRTTLLRDALGKTDWVKTFDRDFLGVLDAIAARRVRRATLTAGKLTAVSPRGTVDAIIVVALAGDLVADLCSIYHVRANRLDTVRIVGTVLLNTATASQADDLTQEGANHVFENLDAHAGWLAGLFGKAAQRVVGAVADGAVNGALMYRLGRLTARALRPLQ